MIRQNRTKTYFFNYTSNELQSILVLYYICNYIHESNVEIIQTLPNRHLLIEKSLIYQGGAFKKLFVQYIHYLSEDPTKIKMLETHFTFIYTGDDKLDIIRLKTL